MNALKNRTDYFYQINVLSSSFNEYESITKLSDLTQGITILWPLIYLESLDAKYFSLLSAFRKITYIYLMEGF